MRLPPHLASLARGTVAQSQIGRAATHAEIEALGKDMDAALRALAVKQEHYCRDEVILALLTVVECIFYVQGRRAMDYDAMLAPPLDQIATQYPNTRETVA